MKCRSVLKRVLSTLVLLLASLLLIAFALAPNNICGNREITRAHHKYINDRSEENKRALDETVARVNHPLWTAQYISGGLGNLSLLWIARVWGRKSKEER